MFSIINIVLHVITLLILFTVLSRFGEITLAIRKLGAKVDEAAKRPVAPDDVARALKQLMAEQAQPAAAPAEKDAGQT